ncbi:MAG: AMP-binding protein [Bacilli bacterium]|nr:AMP-binding protein [Bacilli bacterium]
MLDNLLDVLYNGDNNLFYKLDNEEITYRESYNRVLRLSNNLKKQGNSPIIIYGDKSVNTVIAILSCVVSKRCYIPIYKCTPIHRIKDIIKKTNTSLIISEDKLEVSDIEVLSVGQINNKYKDINTYYENDNKYAYVMFTSGSTGTAKGVPISYDNLNNFINWITNLEEFSDCNDINVLSQASFSFDLSVMDLYFSIYKNNSIIGITSENKSNLSIMYDVIKKNNINFLILTPTLVKLLLVDNYFNSSNFDSIEYMFFCGECLEVETVRKIREKFKNVIIINAYGPTEATCCVTLLEIEDYMLKEEYLPVGKLSNNAVDISIDNNEIVLKGKSVFDGYLDINSDNCYKEFDVSCYKTGDVGVIDGEYLYCKGRIDNQIKYMGYRIELGDIENNLLKIDGVKDAVVICKYKEKTNIVKLIKAFVTTTKKINVEYIREKLFELIPSYMIPKVIEIIDNIPVNDNGKYDRKRLGKL